MLTHHSNIIDYCYIIISMKKNMELLAPVGGLEQFFAAVENGADAVYMGGSKFNARIKAENFSTEQLKDAIRYAHLRNVKVYVTVNILLSEKEIQSAAEYCSELYEMGADGIIVQDLGLASWVKANLPELPLHLSTQGTVYNLSGVRAAETLGFKRVVLARETSLSEIKKITDSCSAEIEMFVHGALCMCYSGQCQMSRVIGGINGRSGNRGLCAQPCRLPYSGEYPLSPKDLCTLDYLDEIYNAGVTSLKIEGRMKSPEYVAVVTGIYRKYLDEYLQNGAYQVSDEDRKALRQIYSRGEFTTGYLFDNPGEDILTVEVPKHQGFYVGEVSNIPNEKFLLDVELSAPLEIGDNIEFRGSAISSSLVTYLKENDNKNNRNLDSKNRTQKESKTFRIGDIKNRVRVGDSIYRTRQASQIKDARKTYEGAAFVDGKCYKCVPIGLEMTLKIGEHPVLEVCESAANFVFTDETVIAEAAINKPLDPTIAERQLRKTGSTCFDVSNVVLNIEEGSTLPVSAINKLRRDALSAYCEFKLNNYTQKSDVDSDYMKNSFADDAAFGDSLPISAINKNDLCTDTFHQDNKTERQLAFYLYDVEKLQTYDFMRKMNLLGAKNAGIYLPLQDFMNGVDLPDYLSPIPYISNISKGNLDEYIEKNFEQIVASVLSTGISIGNLGWIEEFISEGVTVYADYGLNLNNEFAKETIMSLGVAPTSLSLESQEEGGWPIMITEHPLPYDQLIDRMGQSYNVTKTTSDDKWMIFKPAKHLNNKQLLERWEKTAGEFRIYISDKE